MYYDSSPPGPAIEENDKFAKPIFFSILHDQKEKDESPGGLQSVYACYLNGSAPY